LHRSAMFAAGLVLFVLTLLVNGLARVFVLRAARSGGAGARVGDQASAILLAERGAGA
jgi:hypothetical protein